MNKRRTNAAYGGPVSAFYKGATTGIAAYGGGTVFRDPRTGRFTSRRVVVSAVDVWKLFQSQLEQLAAESVANYFPSVGQPLKSVTPRMLEKYNGVVISYDFQTTRRIVDVMLNRAQYFKLIADDINRGDASRFITNYAIEPLIQYLRLIAVEVINRMIYNDESVKLAAYREEFARTQKRQRLSWQQQNVSYVHERLTGEKRAPTYVKGLLDVSSSQSQMQRAFLHRNPGSSRMSFIRALDEQQYFFRASTSNKSPLYHRLWPPYIPTGNLRRAVEQGIQVSMAKIGTVMVRTEVDSAIAPYWKFVHEGHRVVARLHGRVRQIGYMPARPWLPVLNREINAAIQFWATATAQQFCRQFERLQV